MTPMHHGLTLYDVTYCLLNLTNKAHIDRVKRLSDAFYSEVDTKSIRGLTADLTAAHKR